MRRLILAGIFIMILNGAFANAPFFSQYFNSPMNLNPALTGIAFGNIRLVANYKNYFSSVDAFETYALSADMSISGNKNSFMGAGLLFTNDKTGLDYKNTRVMLSGAYHLALSDVKPMYLSFGLQGGIFQTSGNFSNYSTQSQWTGSGYDPTLPNGETVNNESLIQPDFQAGALFYTFLPNNSSMFAGVSVFHLTSPPYSVFDDKARLGTKALIHLGATISVTPKINIVPNVNVSVERRVYAVSGGVSAEYKLGKDDGRKYIGAGIFTRNGDAIVPMLSIEYNSLYLGISYDALMNEISQIQSSGGLEISLKYNIKKKQPKLPKLQSNPNPTM